MVLLKAAILIQKIPRVEAFWVAEVSGVPEGRAQHAENICPLVREVVLVVWPALAITERASSLVSIYFSQGTCECLQDWDPRIQQRQGKNPGVLTSSPSL